MNTTIIAAAAPAPENQNWGEVKDSIVKAMGMEAYLLSYENYLKSVDLTETQRFREYQKVKYNTVVLIQRNYKLN